MKLSFLVLRWISLPIKIFSLLLFAGWWKHLHQRCVSIEPLPDKPGKTVRIWIHVPSIGEVNAVDALLGRLSPNEAISICITTEHFASYSMLVDKYSSSVALVTLAPFDFPFFIKRAWEIIKPDLIISVHQTALFELWHYASAKKVPVTLINASLSTLEFRILGALPIFTRYLVAPFERIYVRSLRDQERFLRLGVLKDNLIIGGNLKSDMQPGPSLTQDERYELLLKTGLFRKEESDQRPLILIGISTWPGEERILLRVMRNMRQQGRDVRLILAPRFPERRLLLKLALRLSKFSVAFHSQNTRVKKNSDTTCRTSPFVQDQQTTDVYFLDVTGELSKVIQIGDVGFVGNSLPPHRKGQNPFESAACGLPIVVGPNTEDFQDEYESLVAAGGCLNGRDRCSTMMEITRLTKDCDLRDQVGCNASNWFGKNSSDSIRIVDHIELLLSEMLDD